MQKRKRTDQSRHEQAGPPWGQRPNPLGNKQDNPQGGGRSSVTPALERDDPRSKDNTAARDHTINSGNTITTQSNNNTTDNSRIYDHGNHNEFRQSRFDGPVGFGGMTNNYYPRERVRSRQAVENIVRTEIGWKKLSGYLSVADQDEYQSTISPFDWNEPKIFWITRNLDFTQWQSDKAPRALLLSASHDHGTTEICSHVIDVTKKKTASRTNGSVLYFFCSPPTEARCSTSLTHTLLSQIVRCSSAGKANPIAAAFLSTLVDGHFQQRSQTFREDDPLDTTVEEILDAPDNELIKALAEAIKEAGIQELSIIVDGLQEDIACWLFQLIRRATSKLEALFTIRHPCGKVPDGMAYIEYDKERKECLRFLQHDDTRYDKISKEHHGSLEWLWTHPQYLQWSASTTSSLLYIEGKPGSGKSTLAKYFEQNLVEREPNARSSTVAHYFYTFRGTELERTHVNMLRSLLHGILEQDESTFFQFQQEFRNFQHRNLSEWPYDSLKKVLSSFANHPSTKPIYLIIDAMDESEEGDRRGIIQLLCELCSEKSHCNIKAFLASRPLAQLKHRIEERHLIIRMQDENKDDISRFADDFLNMDLKLTGKVLSEARNYIVQNAQGVFVWVGLVKSELLYYAETGFTIAEILQALRDLPPELGGFYKLMFDRLQKCQSRDIQTGIKLFRFVLFALRPLTVEELRHALAMLDDHDLSDQKFQENLITGIEGRIEHCGGGFLEIKADSTVQIMHQTAREFLIRTIPNASNFKFESSSEGANRAITTTLIQYLMLCVTSLTSPRSYRDNAEYLNGWPLIDYALRHTREHRDHCGQNESVSKLVTALVRLSTGNQASYFLGSFVDFHFGQNNRLAIPFNKYQATSEDIKYNTLNAAAESKLPHASKALLLTCTQEYSHAEGKTPLIISAQKRLTAATRLLLDQNVDKDAKDNSGRTALHYAAENGDEAIVRLLVEQGAAKIIKDNNGVIALQLALEKLYVSPRLPLPVATMYA